MTENKVNATTPQAKKIQRKIGSTVYEVSLFFNDKSKENMNDKIMRLIRNDPILSTS
ncbi:MAG: transposon-encoded TnpW family protein [Oscillospiraceae bacterium]|nr:transposon-encoded TnpW family protein [Oscillospiraceae bacterium]